MMLISDNNEKLGLRSNAIQEIIALYQ